MKTKILNQISIAQHSTAQHSTAQHSTAQHSTAQHSTAQHKYKLCKLWESKLLGLVLLFIMNGITWKTFAQADKALQKLDKQFFIENKGQWPSEVLYMTKQGGLNAWITKNGMVYDFYKFKEAAKKAEDENQIHNTIKKMKTPKEQYGQIVRMTLEGANDAPEPKASQKGSGYFNYLIGNDKSKWTTEVAQYKEVVLQNTYNNIDTKYYFDEGNIRYDYIIKPGASPSDIKIKLEGTNKTKINADGELVFTTRFGDVKQAKLYTYQMIDGKKVTVTCKFIKLANGKISFDAGTYNKKLPLVVDPLIYSTFMGGDMDDLGFDMTIDGSGNAYIVGGTFSTTPSFPGATTSAGGYDQTYNGNGDGFVIKLNSTGTDLVYWTYIGGTSYDLFNSIEVNQNGNAFVAGLTNSFDYPINSTSPPYDGSWNGAWDQVITELDLTGNSLEYSTFFGGNNVDVAKCIKLDPVDPRMVYFAGYSVSTNFPNTIGPVAAVAQDATVSKIDITAGTSGLVWSRFLTSNVLDDAYGIALDASTNIYVTGRTYATTATISTTYPGIVFGNTGSASLYVAKLNSSGTIIYSTFGGGTNPDYVHAIDVTPAGEAYIVGSTSSPDYPVTTGNLLAGMDDIFITEFNTTGTVASSRYFGTWQEDTGWDIKLFGGNVYITGTTLANTYPTESVCIPVPNPLLQGRDVVVSEFSSDLSTLVFSKRFGSVLFIDQAYSIAVDATGIYVSGYTKAPDYPTTPNCFDNTYNSLNDIFVTKLIPGPGSFTASITCEPFHTACDPKNLYAHPTLPTGTYSYQWFNSNVNSGSTIVSTQAVYNLTQTFATSTTYTVIVTDPNGCTSSAIYVQYPYVQVTALASPSSFYCVGGVSTLSASPNTYVSYDWSSLPVGFTATGSSVTATTNNVTTTYIVIATDAHGCIGTSSTVVTVNPSNFCCSPTKANDINILQLDNTDVQTQTNLGNMSTINTGQSFFINGTFNISQNVQFNNCTIYFTAGSKITLASGRTLTINGSTLESAPGCDMWDGIYADNSTEQIFISNGSTLRDMINGVSVSNNAKISSIGNNYFDNLNSIQLNKNNLTNSCIIENNIFKYVNPMLAPYITQGQPLHGITMMDCNNLNVGNYANVNSGNYFEHMSNGIYIRHLTTGVNNISLYHNRFKQIKDPNTLWSTSLSLNELGWGIYASNKHIFGALNLNILGSLGNTQLNFDDCFKGINLRRASARIEWQNMDNTLLGINIPESLGQTFQINNNSILNTLLGICKNGDESTNGFHASTNTITLNPSNGSFLVNVPDPTGIYSRYNLTSNGDSYIINNIITIPTIDHGIGISLESGTKDIINANQIHFTSTSGTSTFGLPHLIGVYSNVNNNATITSNTIDNNYMVNGNTTFVPGNNVGIFSLKNVESKIQCNNANFLQQGILAGGNNGSGTDYTRTAKNTMRASMYDLLMWEFTLAGSLGRIGKVITNNPYSAYNANNTFLGPLYTKVYRFHTSTCIANYPEEIVTTQTQLDPNQSIATNPACKVPVTNPSQGFTSGYVCNGTMLAEDESIDYALAMQIAEESLEYEQDFEDGARRAMDELLYSWLERNDSLRNSAPLLDSFYLSNQNASLGLLNKVNNEIAALSDSIILADSIRWNDTLQMAKTHNMQMSTVAVFDANAKWINALYLKVVENEAEVLTEAELADIETLANTCPYTAGNAVFTARSLFGMFSPGIHYDDIEICNSQGIYKDGISKLQQQLNEISHSVHSRKLNENSILVYPIPANQSITIEYMLNENEEGEFVIYDMLGNQLQKIKLFGNIQHTNMDVSHLAKGMYTYKVTTSGYHSYAGKLIID